jgi:DNA-binding phage protein
MADTKTAHEAVLNALIPEIEREQFDNRVDALIARNREARARVISLISEALVARGMSKRELAQRTGLNESAVRRLLTAEDANPTLDTVVRFVHVLGIDIVAALPSGEQVQLVEAHA